LSLTSSKFTALPIEVAQLTKLESINLNLYNQKNSANTINYAGALYKIQNLPNLKSISLVFSKDNIGDFGQLNFPNLQTLNLENINFNTHYNMVDFITNQKNLIKLHIKGQNFKNIDNRFENLINLT